MSNEQHTQGRLADDLSEHDAPYQDIRLKIGNRTICVVYIDDAPVHDYNSEQIANARRLVACWNACEGIPTEVLEAQRAGGLPWRVSEQIDIRMQRDELLAVASNFDISGPDDDGLVWLILRGHGTTGRAMFKLGKESQIAVQVALHMEQDRRAAIAKVKGGAV